MRRTRSGICLWEIHSSEEPGCKKRLNNEFDISVMCSLLYDVHLWTLRDDSNKIPSTDSSCFKYGDRSDLKSSVMGDTLVSRDKISYANEKNTHWLGRKPQKLKSGLREMENLLSEQSVVFSKWRTPSLYQMVLSSSIVLNVEINSEGDVDKLNIDKSLVGKLVENIVSMDFTNQHLIATSIESNVVIAYFKHPISFSTNIDPLASLIDSLIHPEIFASSLKRSIRHVQLSRDSSFFLLWWSHSKNEVHPWSPLGPEQENYNILLYNLKNKSSSPRVVYSMNSGSDPILFEFRKNEDLLYLGQEVYSVAPSLRNSHLEPSRSNFLDYSFFTNGSGKIKRRVNIPSQVSCAGLAKDLVVLGFSNGNLQIFDIAVDQMEYCTKVPFVPCMIKVHPDGVLFFTSNKRGVIQCFDIALNPIRLWNGDNPDGVSLVLDIGQYFLRGVTLEDASWCPSVAVSSSNGGFSYPNSIILRFQGGPILLMRIFGGVYNNSGRSIQPIHLTLEYLKNKNYSGILRLLRLLNWTNNGHSILVSLNASFNVILRSRRSDDIIEDLLSLFYSPRIPIPQSISEEYSEQIRDLSRRYFHHLLRRGRTGKAFQLAVDIEDYDLFMDLYHVSVKYNYSDIADAALVKAHSIYEESSLERISPKIEDNRVALPGDNLHFQPQLSATYTKTTAAKLISTMYYQQQERSDEPQMDESRDSIKVINFGAV